jgi:hypothetical protein
LKAGALAPAMEEKKEKKKKMQKKRKRKDCSLMNDEDED